jgi:hypothetical protein
MLDDREIYETSYTVSNKYLGQEACAPVGLEAYSMGIQVIPANFSELC